MTFRGYAQFGMGRNVVPRLPKASKGRVALLIAAVSLVILAVPSAALAVTPPILNVAYGAGEKQVTDIYPATNPGAATVVMVHGGGWTTNDKKVTKLESESLQKAGFLVFNINYRLDTKTVQAFPMEVEDVESATHYAIAHAGEHNGNASKLVYVGGSAGGQLVGSAAEALNQAVPGTVKAVVTLSGAFDFPLLLQADREGKLNKNFSKNVPQALGCSLETTCKTAEKEAWAVQWSPARQVTSTNCASGGWLIFNSQEELMPLNQPTAMKTALETNGCGVKETIVPGKEHAFYYWRAVKPSVISFIQSQ
jgi:acetyl esterase/lipase